MQFASILDIVKIILISGDLILLRYIFDHTVNHDLVLLLYISQDGFLCLNILYTFGGIHHRAFVSKVILYFSYPTGEDLAILL